MLSGEVPVFPGLGTNVPRSPTLDHGASGEFWPTASMFSTRQVFIVADALVRALGPDADMMVAAKIIEVDAEGEREQAAYWRLVKRALKALVLARSRTLT